jgi:exo-beta-1,3-glucanase (GH17 family)
MKKAFVKISLACLLVFGLAALTAEAGATPRKADLTKQQWNGNAIDYSGYRVGQSPELNRFPTQAQILEDLTILKKNWKLIRLYGADQHSQDVLEVIRHNKLGIKVLLGIWLDGRPGYEGGNRRADCHWNTPGKSIQEDRSGGKRRQRNSGFLVRSQAD